ncbi:MAG: FliH/SctL family protein [Planctomycetota bacterium]|nr:FliH/SctL family protein [Planctomycetota bacterium]
MSDPVSYRSDTSNAEGMSSVEMAQRRLEALQSAYAELRRNLVEEGNEMKAAVEQARRETDEHVRRKISEANQRVVTIEEDARIRGEAAGHKDGAEAGFVEGMQKGLEESRRQADHQVQERAMALLGDRCDYAPQLLMNVFEEFNSCWKITIDEVRRDTVALARGIAERILRKEIVEFPQLVNENIELAVQRICDRRKIRIEVNPVDLSTVIEFLPALDEKMQGVEGAEVVGVDSICRGGCRVRSETGSVDLGIDTQLDLIESALIQDAQES